MKAYKVVSRQTFMKHFLISDEEYKTGEDNQSIKQLLDIV